jgi:hypothetical protein
MLKLLVVALVALSCARAAPAPALTSEQADALAGTWVLESGDRLYGLDYDKLLLDAAANDTIDPKALLEQALDAQPGPSEPHKSSCVHCARALRHGPSACLA